MTNLTGIQIGKIGNKYEPKLDTTIILDGNKDNHFTKYESYKEQLKERIQRKVGRKEELFQTLQEKEITTHFSFQKRNKEGEQ